MFKINVFGGVVLFSLVNFLYILEEEVSSISRLQGGSSRFL
jgi:hypothetical protein